MVITRVAPLSCAKVAGVLYVLLGLIFGCLVSLAALAGGFGGSSAPSGIFGVVFGVGAVLVLPICYGALGFVMTFIMAGLFNVAAGFVGGVEVDAK